MSILESAHHDLSQERTPLNNLPYILSISVEIDSERSQTGPLSEENQAKKKYETIVSYSRLISYLCILKGSIIVFYCLMILFKENYFSNYKFYIIQGLFDITVGVNGLNSTHDRDSFEAFCFALLLIFETITFTGNLVPFFLIISGNICEMFELSNIFLFVLTGLFINATLILMAPVNICAWKFYFLVKEDSKERNTTDNIVNPETSAGP